MHATDVFSIVVMKFLSTVLLFFVFVLQGFWVHAQILPVLGGQRVGLSTLGFLKNDLSPQSSAMGGAGIGLTPNAFATNNNPGGLALLEAKSLAVSNLTLGAGVHQSFISYIQPAKNGSAWGVSLNSLNTGLMEVRTEFMPQGTGEKFGNHFSFLGLSYGKRLSSKFSVGGTIKYVFENLGGATNQTATGDLGFLYQLGTRDLKFAVLFQNFGGNSSIGLVDVPNNFNRNNFPVSQSTVPTTFKMGLSFCLWEKANHRLISAFQLNHPNDNSENYRIGMEYKYRELLCLRMGYKIAFKGHDLPTFGLSIGSRLGIHPMSLNYSVLPTNGLGMIHLLGLTLRMNEKSRNE